MLNMSASRNVEFPSDEMVTKIVAN
jgi:hypothetical protein